MEYKHEPVMLKEILDYFNPSLGQFFIDCTLGGGGYSIAIAERIGKTGKVLAIDMDKVAIENAKKIIKQIKIENIILAHDNFKNLSKIYKKYFKEKKIKFSGIVFDLGLSSAQLQDRNRGFSFQLDAPLNMGFGEPCLDIEKIINSWSIENLEEIIKKYGEDRNANQIAKEIVNFRKKTYIKTTGQLAQIIKNAVFNRKSKIHPATKTFQALRIVANNELNNLKEALPVAVSLLKSGGRIIVISYHSLEDRIVKRFFSQESKNCLCPPKFPICRCGHKSELKIIKSVVTKRKVIKPTDYEIKDNPRSRSAKMRVAEKI